jgi:hypothetical protein
MTKTFQFKILNSSFYNQNTSTQDTSRVHKGSTTSVNAAKHMLNTARTGAGCISSPRTVRPVKAETSIPFTVIPNAKIPDLTDQRREDRDERQHSLRRIPKHKVEKISG